MAICQALPYKQLTAKSAICKTLAAVSKDVVYLCYHPQLCNIP
jgi:hypothetical protein